MAWNSNSFVLDAKFGFSASLELKSEWKRPRHDGWCSYFLLQSPLSSREHDNPSLRRSIFPQKKSIFENICGSGPKNSSFFDARDMDCVRSGFQHRSYLYESRSLHSWHESFMSNLPFARFLYSWISSCKEKSAWSHSFSVPFSTLTIILAVPFSTLKLAYFSS